MVMVVMVMVLHRYTVRDIILLLFVVRKNAHVHYSYTAVTRVRDTHKTLGGVFYFIVSQLARAP
jgi:hypothetical protein